MSTKIILFTFLSLCLLISLDLVSLLISIFLIQSNIQLDVPVIQAFIKLLLSSLIVLVCFLRIMGKQKINLTYSLLIVITFFISQIVITAPKSYLLLPNDRIYDEKVLNNPQYLGLFNEKKKQLLTQSLNRIVIFTLLPSMFVIAILFSRKNIRNKT